MARPFDHDLAAFGPSYLRQLTQRFKLGKLGAVIGVGNCPRAQAITEREADIIPPHNVANLFEMFV